MAGFTKLFGRKSKSPPESPEVRWRRENPDLALPPSPKYGIPPARQDQARQVQERARQVQEWLDSGRPAPQRAPPLQRPPQGYRPLQQQPQSRPRQHQPSYSVIPPTQQRPTQPPPRPARPSAAPFGVQQQQASGAGPSSSSYPPRQQVSGGEGAPGLWERIGGGREQARQQQQNQYAPQPLQQFAPQAGSRPSTRGSAESGSAGPRPGTSGSISSIGGASVPMWTPDWGDGGAEEAIRAAQYMEGRPRR